MYEHQYHAQQIAKELQNFDVKSFNRDYLGATLLKGVSYMKFFIAGNIEQQECLDLSESVFTKMFGD